MLFPSYVFNYSCIQQIFYNFYDVINESSQYIHVLLEDRVPSPQCSQVVMKPHSDHIFSLETSRVQFLKSRTLVPGSSYTKGFL